MYFCYFFIITLGKGHGNLNLHHPRILCANAVNQFESGHHGSSGPLLIRTMSPKSKAMSPNFISGRNIKQAGKCSKGSLFREWINSENDNRQRKVPKKGGSHCSPSAFNINQALKLGRSQTSHISDLSVSKRTWIYAS